MSPRAKAQLAFRSAVVLLFASGILTVVTTGRLLSAQAWVRHTNEVQRALFEVSTLSTRAGRARTEYVDSGEERFRVEFDVAVAPIPDLLEELRGLIRDNVAQRGSFVNLNQLIQRRLDLLNRSMRLRESGTPAPDQQAAFRQAIIDVSRDMDRRLQIMQDEEERLLERRREESQRLFRQTGGLVVAIFVLACLLLLVHQRLLTSELAARERAEKDLHRLSARLLQLQDEERRRFSRELHDSLGQYLSALNMNLATLDQSLPGNALLAESQSLLEHCVVETRTISHLLHPPLLDEAGFASAAAWYVQGFSKRSGIDVELDISPELSRLPNKVSLALFRILQEALVNLHRHSGSARARVSARREGGDLALRITDYGKGIPPDVLERLRQDRAQDGVGLAGMRERMRELGGRLDIESTPARTEVCARLRWSEDARLPEALAS